MTLYLTDDTPPEEIARAKLSGRVHGVKLYPAGATTHSDAGVTRISRCFRALETMEQLGLPLLVHGEVDRSRRSTCSTASRRSSRKCSGRCVERFPRLKVVLEHITTRDAVQYVEVTGPNVAATITAHHLLLNRNALFVGGIRPHHYCLPVLKREEHREALVEAATSGNPKFFLGTDSAPHARATKEAACGCAGIYTAHAAIELYATAFEEAGALDKLEGFASQFGARLLRPAAQRGARSRWCARSGPCPKTLRFGGERAGAAARRRNDPLEAGSSASGLRRRAAAGSSGSAVASLEQLNALAEERGSAHAKRQAACASCRRPRADPYYEISVFETGRVQTRAGQPARPVQRARLARLSAHQGAHQRHARRARSRARRGRRGARCATC